jgi:FixJ family two-component response regulator
MISLAPAGTADAIESASERIISSDEIFIVDDDPLITDLLDMTFKFEGYRVTSFSNGEAFTAVARARAPGCIILDVFMPGRSGLDILKDINAHSYAAPIIVMSGKANVSLAVEAVKNGAFDFIEKPFVPDTMVTRVRESIKAWLRRRAPDNTIEIGTMEFPGCHRLTQRELEVLAEIVAAASNREAGRHLGISSRTVEVHRARIMTKLRAKNTADLVRIALTQRQPLKLALGSQAVDGGRHADSEATS